MSQESSEDENPKKSARLEVFATDGADSEQTFRVTLRKDALVMDLRKQVKVETGCNTPHPSIMIRDPAHPGQYLSPTKPITAKQTYTFDIPPPSLSGEERLANRWRGYLQNPSQHQNLVEELQRIAQRKDAGPGSDGRLCQPLAVQGMFGLKEWGETLIEARKQLQGLDASDTVESRRPRVLSLVAGTGFGKTHAMLHSAEAIKAASGEDHTEDPELLYIAYNLSQPLELDADVAHSQTAVLLRVLLCRLGFTNVTTGRVLVELHVALSSLRPETKQWLEVVFQHIKTVRRPRHVVVCVDECRNIGQAAQRVTWILGELAFRLEQEGIRCTVLLSSLASRTFVWSGGRPTVSVVLPGAKNNAAEFVLQEILPKANDRQKAMVAGAGGAHWRSLVTMCKWLSESSEVAVQHVHRALAERLYTRLNLEEQLALRRYIRNTVSEGTVSALSTNTEAEIMVDCSMAVPPAIVFTIFDEADGIPRGEHPAQQLFECSVFVGPSKQLETSGMHYDRFRALYNLPVLPREILVRNATGNEWFRSLVFPNDVAQKGNLVEESLLHVKGKDKRVQRTDVQPMVGKYYLPKNESHPWVDRAVVAHATEDARSTCLVLYQDKINERGFPEAVKDLNEAAKLFASDFTNVLCVACVLGASSETTAQAAFEFPHVLVRDHEVSSFFTPTFAQAIHVLRQRHCVPPHDDGDEHQGQLPLRLQLAD